jgi:SAM-dependent methyltransferase
MFVPSRRNTPEFLDDPATDLAAISRSGDEIAACNRMFGGTNALLAELKPLWPALRPRATMLDVGCGVGDLPAAAKRSAGAHGVELTVFALDRRGVLARDAASRVDGALVGDAFALPLRDGSFDVVTACQFLHHFSDAEITGLAREMHRVACRRVIVSDLRRNWLAAGGLWLASWPLRFHSITRHDGVASVLKGFVPGELRRVLSAAVDRPVDVTRRAAFRVTASWNAATS